MIIPAGLKRLFEKTKAALSDAKSRRHAIVLAVFLLPIVVAASFYLRYAHLVDETLRADSFGGASIIYAAPRAVLVGEEAHPDDLAAYLRRCGYSPASPTERNRPAANRMGTFVVGPDSLLISPGPDAFDHEGALIRFQSGHVSQIVSLLDHGDRPQIFLEPQPITNLFDSSREKRMLVNFSNIPKVMINAILSAEDKRFFQHSGFDGPRIIRALWLDLRRHRNLQGASTLTQQLARSLWLGPERGWRRKIPEFFITLHLEHTLTKQQIFEDYANFVYLGRQGSFSLQGFAKASQVYFGKDLNRVGLPEAALLAGLIQAPNNLDPLRHPDRAKARRNVVLKAMRANGFISAQEYSDAAAAPVNVARGDTDSSDAPYFVDLVNDALQSRFQDFDFLHNSYRVFTTLDTNLQRDAVEAIRTGIQETDRAWQKRSTQYGTRGSPEAQVAMVVLDAHTGEVKALVGGRNYGQSQLNRAIARRQPGSAFKPFVYAAAMSPSQGGSQTLTPASTVVDEPTVFNFNGETYHPADEEASAGGPVTLRYALSHSLNVPTVKVAETVGYNRVAKLAKASGLNIGIKATPSMALGSYEVTPLELAGAYTVFANSGSFLKPEFVRSIHDRRSVSVFELHPSPVAAVDPRAAFLVESMMEDVLRSGTGWGVRARGFYLPAAGKTGSSRDAWFVGFTSRLICAVWVGFDDNRDLKLLGADAAVPIWTEFMKRAHEHPEYKNVRAFNAPSGIVSAQIDAETGELAAPGCSKVRTEFFIAGTQPAVTCHLHGGGTRQIAAEAQ